MFDLDKITRKNIRELVPYSSARDEFSAKANIRMDANENPFDTELNRYPDPYQRELKNAISEVKGISTDRLFVGNGSDEAIDLLFRAFCEPGKDKAYTFPPTYGMYEVSAKINNVETVEIPLTQDFALPEIERLQSQINSGGLLFICSPNNPTGNTFPLESIKELANTFNGLVVVDEAYIEFSESESAVSLLNSTPNLVVLQTMSKARGMAGLRLGVAMASPEIIEVLNKVKPPYNINTLSQEKGIELLQERSIIQKQISTIQQQRDLLIDVLREMSFVKRVFPSEANFVLAIFENPIQVFQSLQNNGIIVRDRTSQIPGALRISVGTPNQNQQLITALKEMTL